jgi:hypothetical protein
MLGNSFADLRGPFQQLQVVGSVWSAFHRIELAMCNSPHASTKFVLDQAVDFVEIISSRDKLLLILLEVAMNRVCVE